MRILDLFCGAGGAAMGYHQAFPDAAIIGIDIERQPNYPFIFRQADALDPPVNLDQFDLIHASPPCQHFTRYRNAVKDITERYDDHIAATRALLAGRRYVIENVPGAPIRNDVELCGSMVGLDMIRRHRWFEIEPPITVLTPPHNHLQPRRFKSSTGRNNLRRTIEIGAWDEPVALQKQAMGVDWDISLRELSEAIPPAYTKFIGESLKAAWVR